MTDAKVAAAIRLGRDWCWRHGDLTHLLHDGQLELHRQYLSTQGRFVAEIARRWGKTYWLLVLSVMTLAEYHKRTGRPGRVVYGAPTLKHLEEFVLPTLDKLRDDAPADVRPEFAPSKSHIETPWGHIHLFGADDKRKADRGRGSEAILAVFDEAGFTPLLRYVLSSIFRPSLLHTGGRVVLASTPAEEIDHDFTNLAEKAEGTANYARRTVWQNPLLTEAAIKAFIEQDAKDEGFTVEQYMASDAFRREYLAERVINRMLVALPEWVELEDELTVEVERPRLFRVHAGIDFGGTDPHFAAWGYWHLEHGLVVEDELELMADEVSTELSVAIKQKERERYGIDSWDGTMGALRRDSLEKYFGADVPKWARDSVEKVAAPQPWLRVCDTDMKLARHLAEVGIAVVPTQKDNKQLHVQRLRGLIAQRQVKVHPRCERLKASWRTTTWKDERRTEWARRGGRHGDGVDAGCYLVRNLDRDVPLETPAVKGADLSAMLLGDSPMARKLRGLK